MTTEPGMRIKPAPSSNWKDNRPRRFHLSWPVSGLASQTASPSHAHCTVVLRDGQSHEVTLVYRCGGSTHSLMGKRRVSRLTAHMDMCAGTRTKSFYLVKT